MFQETFEWRAGLAFTAIPSAVREDFQRNHPIMSRQIVVNTQLIDPHEPDFLETHHLCCGPLVTRREVSCCPYCILTPTPDDTVLARDGFSLTTLTFPRAMKARHLAPEYLIRENYLPYDRGYSDCPPGRVYLYPTTIFTNLSGTTITFLTCLPSRNGWTLGSARAAFSRAA